MWACAEADRRERAMSLARERPSRRRPPMPSRTSSPRGCANAPRWPAPSRADPDVLLGDEPFGALDAQARELLQDEVQRVWVESESRKTFVFVTHNVREAALLADRVLVMTAAPGRLLEEVRIHAPRPRHLDDALVSRVVTEIHDVLMGEVSKGVAREAAGEGARSAADRHRRAGGRLGDRGVARLDRPAFPSPSEVWSAFTRGVSRRHDPGGGGEDAPAARVLVRGLDRDRRRRSGSGSP